jgi:hypothetical protein
MLVSFILVHSKTGVFECTSSWKARNVPLWEVASATISGPITGTDRMNAAYFRPSNLLSYIFCQTVHALDNLFSLRANCVVCLGKLTAEFEYPPEKDYKLSDFKGNPVDIFRIPKDAWDDGKLIQPEVILEAPLKYTEETMLKLKDVSHRLKQSRVAGGNLGHHVVAHQSRIGIA